MSISDHLYFLTQECSLSVLARVPFYISCTRISELLADKVTPDFNFKEQLWFIARANAQEAAEYLCLLLRTQFDFQLEQWQSFKPDFRPDQYGKSFFHRCLTDLQCEDHGPCHEILLASNAKDIARRALILRDARQRLQNDPSPFPFLQLPFEIRLRVYEVVFINNRVINVEANGYYWMADDIEHESSNNIFGNDISTDLLFTNRQIFNEAEPILYQTRFLKIGDHLDRGLEFLRSLSPRARRNIRAVDIAQPRARFQGAAQGIGISGNEKAWCRLCCYMSQNLRLRALSFDISAEPPPDNFVDAAWVKYLVMIRGLKRLQPKISFLSLHELMNYESDPEDLSTSWNGDVSWYEILGYESDPEDESDRELDPDSQKGLDARRQALISFLKSEMC